MAPSIQLSIINGEDVGGVRRFNPGDLVQGSVQVIPDSDIQCEHIYVRARWYTQGRGDEDEGIGAEQDVYQGELREGVPSYYRFHLKLPQEPWSFAGRYVNILWEIEITIDIPWARDPKTSELIIMADSRT